MRKQNKQSSNKLTVNTSTTTFLTAETGAAQNPAEWVRLGRLRAAEVQKLSLFNTLPSHHTCQLKWLAKVPRVFLCLGKWWLCPSLTNTGQSMFLVVSQSSSHSQLCLGYVTSELMMIVTVNTAFYFIKAHYILCNCNQLLLAALANNFECSYINLIVLMAKKILMAWQNFCCLWHCFVLNHWY